MPCVSEVSIRSDNILFHAVVGTMSSILLSCGGVSSVKYRRQVVSAITGTSRKLQKIYALFVLKYYPHLK